MEDQLSPAPAPAAPVAAVPPSPGGDGRGPDGPGTGGLASDRPGRDGSGPAGVEPAGVDPAGVEPFAVEPVGWLSVPEVADRLGVPVTRVHQFRRDGTLLAVRRDGVWRLPEELVPRDGEDRLGRHLGGVLTLLRDAGFDDEAALRWLYTPDDSLPGTPAVGLRERPTEVKRRAQALGY